MDGEVPTHEEMLVKAIVPSRRYEKEIYPRCEDQEALAEVYKSYMSGTDLEAAATLHGVPWRTVQLWARRAGWVEEKAKFDRVAIMESNRRLALSRAEKVNRIVDTTVRVQEKIVRQVEVLVEESGGKLKPGELKSAAEAAKNASDNALRAVGIGENGGTAEESSAAAKAGKTPLVVVIQGGGLPPMRKADVSVVDS